MQIKLGAVAVTTALVVTGFMGLRAAEALHDGANPPANVKVTQRSEAASAHGYSAVVKQVVPAVVNISSTKIVKAQAGDGQAPEDLFANSSVNRDPPGSSPAAANPMARPGGSTCPSRISGRRARIGRDRQPQRLHSDQ